MRRKAGLGPVARFSLALGGVLACTAIALAAGTAYLIDRYVQSDTARSTESAVASHFGTVFRNDVFERSLTETERDTLEGMVAFHFSIYNVVATQFLLPNGTIVFSYDESEIGRRLDPVTTPGLRSVLAGTPYVARGEIVGDLRYTRPGVVVYDSERGGAMDHSRVMPSEPQMARVDALETWVPVTGDGKLIGAAAVWRDLAPVQLALREIQLVTATIIGLAAILLWLVLRRVYVRSSQQIVAQATEIEMTYDTTLQALSNALDLRDTETEGHARRVVEYMEIIAREMRLPEDEIAVLRRGALLHDIGKVGVPDRILRKPAGLTEAEWVTMKTHPDLGARIIGGIPFLEKVAVIVRHHHERWDGRGYPDGLAGEAIPLGARIFTVADSFDAMTSDRPYRDALRIDEARVEIRRCRGTQFDPVIAEAFSRIPVERLVAVHDQAPHAHVREAAAS